MRESQWRVENREEEEEEGRKCEMKDGGRDSDRMESKRKGKERRRCCYLILNKQQNEPGQINPLNSNYESSLSVAKDIVIQYSHHVYKCCVCVSALIRPCQCSSL